MVRAARQKRREADVGRISHRISRQLQRLLAQDRPPVPADASGPRDGPRAARLAKLKYVLDTRPGIRRSGSPARFAYLKPNGKPVTDPGTLARIKALAIPPAWTE